jgi:hypothetical protein
VIEACEYLSPKHLRMLRCLIQAEAFRAEVIDLGEDAEAPAAGQRVRHEVKRSAQIAILRHGHRRPGTERTSFDQSALSHILRRLVAAKAAQAPGLRVAEQGWTIRNLSSR